jgi:ABC-type nitrate/sulfonate/bicarbonate transport system permease component
VVRVGRWIAPRFVLDQHVPALAVFVLFWLWVGLKFAQVQLLFEAGYGS